MPSVSAYAVNIVVSVKVTKTPLEEGIVKSVEVEFVKFISKKKRSAVNYLNIPSADRP
ncbi:hypothetical protein L9F63_021297, partial [Diploptera punctata]